MIDKLSGLTPQNLPQLDEKTKQNQNKKEDDFLSTLNDFMSDVNQLQKESGESVQKLVSGDINNVHEVMVAVEKANVSFEFMMEIRNKVIEAYREIMRTR